VPTLHLVYRSYGGENAKGRPAYYSKVLTLASFVRAAERVPDADVVFVNDGPVPPERLALMERAGRILQIGPEPIGMRGSYRFGLALPDRESWPDFDVVSYIEDDYLFHPGAFTALAEAARDLDAAEYFALGGERPVAESFAAARQRFSLPHDRVPAADVEVNGRVWFNVPSTTSTFSARVGTLRKDLPIFRQCMLPFRRRFLDHETCLLYQGYVPYRGMDLLRGLPEDFEPSIRGVARTIFLVPFRVALDIRGLRQKRAHLLYAPTPSLAAHLEADLVDDDQDWPLIAADVARWSEAMGLVDASAAIRARLGP
jgi:hypothetical protein